MEERPHLFAAKTVAAAVGVAVSLTVLFVFNPAITSFFPPCPLHRFTGWYCPGCGSLRATHLLLHGHLHDAFRMNPLFVLSIPVIGALLIRPSWSYKTWVPWAAFIVLIGYGVLRNIPIWPFCLLAPG